MGSLQVEIHEIVIVGAGICGLATALALHRKGIRCLVLERADGLRATGVSLVVHDNGWRAMDHLGIGTKLRNKSVKIHGMRYTSLDDNTVREQPSGELEQRCVKRSNLINALAEDLPARTLRFGCRVVAIEVEPSIGYNLLHLDDGTSISAKVLVGCDGVNSIVADFIGMKPAKFSFTMGIRGMTNYPDGHNFPKEFFQIQKQSFLFGRYPIDDKLVYWFLARPWNPTDATISRDAKLMTESTLAAAEGFPPEIADMVRRNEMDCMNCGRIRYRHPWDQLKNPFRKGTVTVAGDAMHAMGPFLAQGGASALEDGVVLGCCLAGTRGGGSMEAAIDEYIAARWGRVMRLSAQTYMMGLAVTARWKLVKVVFMLLVMLLFGKGLAHARFDCGPI